MQEEDFGLGVIVMFISAVVSILEMICLVLCNSDIMGASIPSSIKTKQTKEVLVVGQKLKMFACKVVDHAHRIALISHICSTLK